MAGRRPKDGVTRDKMMSLRLPINLHAWLVAASVAETRKNGGKPVTMSDIVLRAITRERTRGAWRTTR